MGPVYTAYVTVRHDELDRFGRLHPGVYLRYLAHAAVEASAAAGCDGAWYARAGAMWLVRRSTLAVARPARAGERLAIRTWVEDFRRVRSHRRYVVQAADGAPVLDALTDWVYLDVATQAVLDAIEDAGWSLDRMLAAGHVPVLTRADLEYLEGARYGDRLGIATWFTWTPEALDAHQRIVRAGGERPLVRVSTRWRWVAAAGGEPLAVPDGVRAALRPLLAA